MQSELPDTLFKRGSIIQAGKTGEFERLGNELGADAAKLATGGVFVGCISESFV